MGSGAPGRPRFAAARTESGSAVLATLMEVLAYHICIMAAKARGMHSTSHVQGPKRNVNVNLAAATLLALVAMLPAPIHGGWFVSKSDVAQLFVFDSFSFLELKQTVSEFKEPTVNEPTVTASGTLGVVDPATGTRVQSIKVEGALLGVVVSTPTYKNPGAATSFNVSLVGMDVEGCVTGLEPPTPEVCSPMKLDVSWVARGVRNAESLEETSLRRTDYFFTTPPSSSTTRVIVKFKFDQYLSTNPISLLLTKADTQAVLFNSSLSCQDPGVCEFLVGEEPGRSYSRA